MHRLKRQRRALTLCFSNKLWTTTATATAKRNPYDVVIAYTTIFGVHHVNLDGINSFEHGNTIWKDHYFLLEVVSRPFTIHIKNIDTKTRKQQAKGKGKQKHIPNNILLSIKLCDFLSAFVSWIVSVFQSVVSLNLMCNFESHTKNETFQFSLKFCLSLSLFTMSPYNLNIIVSKALYHHKNGNKSEVNQSQRERHLFVVDVVGVVVHIMLCYLISPLSVINIHKLDR